MRSNMKKIILALMAVASVATANAQKNSILVYGNLGLNNTNTDNGTAGSTNDLGWNVSPGVGYQFNDNWTVGIQGSIGMWNNDNTAPYTLNTTRNITLTNQYTDWRAGAFLRYTHYISNMFSFWTQLDLSYLGGSTSMENVNMATSTPTSPVIATTTDNYSGFGAGITPAIGIHVAKGFALNFSFGGLGFSTTSWDKAPVTETNFGLTFGQQFNFGITKNFGCGGKKKSTGDAGMHMRKMKKHEADEDDE